MGAMARWVKHGLLTVFGRLSWQPPHWLGVLIGVSQRRGAAVTTLIRERPRQAATVALAVLALALAAVLIWRWHESRPRPIEVAYTIDAPALTCYTCEPPVSPKPLTVQFAASSAPLQHIGHPLQAQQAGIEMSPQLTGQWRWDDDRTLRFQPATDWPIGTRFKVRFARAGFTAAQVRLARYAFEFHSAPFAAKIAATQFYQDPSVASDKKAVVTIAFTHPVDPASFERQVSLRMFARLTGRLEKELTAPAHSIVYDKLKLHAYIHSAQLEVPAKAGRLLVQIDSGVRAARGGEATREMLTTSVEVPGLNSLRVANISLDIVRNQDNDPDQVLLVQTSFSVSERDLPAKVHAWLLPLAHPDPKLQHAFERSNPGAGFAWNPANFRPEVLREQAQLPLTQIPGEHEHYELHSLRYQATPGRYLYVKVDAGLKSFGGYVLGEPLERILKVPEFPRELRILQDGSLLALSGEKKLTVFARNVPAVRVEIGRLLPRQLQHLVTQTSGNYARPQFNHWAFDAANITERSVTVLPLPQVAPGQAQYEAIDLGEYLTHDTQERRGIFLLRVQAFNPQTDHALHELAQPWNARPGHLSDARLVIVTDLGLIVKHSSDGSQDVFVQSIATGAPVAGASVEVIGRNGLAVLSETSDLQGHARFADLKSLRNERAPIMYLVRHNGDSSFLPLDERGRSLDLSRFDVGGIQASAERGALSAYIFSDRGIYRPGEQIRAAAIVRSQDFGRTLQGVPLRLEITDPRGTVVRRQTYLAGAAGFGEILHHTSPSSPAGTYTLALSVVQSEQHAELIGSTTVQVRDFQPDRLRMQARLSASSARGWVSPENLKAQVSLQNLFGTPAENRRITAQLTLNPSIPAFASHPGYQFHDPQYAREGFTEPLQDTATDAAGNATLTLNLQRFARATYRLHLLVQGFEADGGRGVYAETAQLVSNMPYLVGYKPDGELGYLPRQARRTVHLIAIDPAAQRTAVNNLQLVRFEIRHVSVLMRQSNGTFKYESRRRQTTLEERALSIGPSGIDLPLATEAPGNFAYAVRDAAGLELARFDYQVAGEGNLTRALERNAELQLTLAKQEYAAGEQLELSIRAPYAGAGLITIERERVYAWQWFKTTTTSSVQKIKLPTGLEGNAYVAVTFVRDLNSPEIYMSPLSYGVVPFSIDTAARRNALTVNAPAQVKPGEQITLRYRAERPARMVVFAVDEGILQVANYRTPDPLGHFFQKRALQVRTQQILDLILPELRHLGLSAATGGDAEELLGKHLNPFRRKGEQPVVYWSGIVDADATTRELKYVVPDYFNGTLRIMALAVSDDQIGVHESRVLVRGDFVLAPNAPTTVTPGDEFEISLGVTNNLEGSGAQAMVAVSINTDRALEVIGGSTQQVRIAEGRESVVRFRLRARAIPGVANLHFVARTARGSDARHTDLSIRPATPYMTHLQAGVLTRGQQIKLGRSLYPHHRKLEAGVSLLPLQFAHGFISYLGSYPYACTEQLASQAMPAVLLGSRAQFGYVRTMPGADFPTLLAELRSRQNDAGAYKLWPGGDSVAEFVSLYVQHLLLEAAERGHPVPGNLLASGNMYLRRLARRDGSTLAEERHSAYAIYLLTRQAQRLPAEIAAARQRLESRYRGQWEQDLVAAWLAAALQMIRQERDAGQLIGRMRFAAAVAQETYNDPMTRDALLLFILARHFPGQLPRLPQDVLTTLARRIDAGSYHSLSAGTTLLALDAYATATEETAGKLSISEVLADHNVRPLALSEEVFAKVAFSEQARALKFSNDTGLPAFYLIEQSGFDRQPPAQVLRQGLEVLREYTDAQGNALQTVLMGQQVDVHLKFRSLKPGGSSAVALVELLPGGFELVVPAPVQPGLLTESESPEHEDSGAATHTGWRCPICIGEPKAHLQYADMREDRVVFYVSAAEEVSELVYRIQATNAGTFVVPPAYGEAMYERSVAGRSAAGRITVRRP